MQHRDIGLSGFARAKAARGMGVALRRIVLGGAACSLLNVLPVAHAVTGFDTGFTQQINNGGLGLNTTDLERMTVHGIGGPDRWVDGGRSYSGISVDQNLSGGPADGGGAGGEFQKNDTEKEQETDEKKCPDTSSNPVILATGNKIEPEVDFVAGGEMGLYLRRVYNHQWTASGLFGAHWLSNFDYTIAPSTDGSVLWAQRPDGRRIKFIYNATTALWEENKASPVAFIARLGDGTYVLHNEERGTERYSADGYITELKSEQGIAWTFAYDGKYLRQVTHTSGSYITFHWSDGRLVEVKDPARNTYAYAYSANALGTGRHRLASTTLPGAPQTTITYHFEDSRFPGGLTGKSFNGQRYSTFTYDGQGRAVVSEHAGQVERSTFDYVVEATEQVTPPPAPPPPGGYPVEGGGGGGWCDYVPGNGQICYDPLRVGVSPMRVGADSGVVAMSSGNTKARPTIMRVTETNPLGKVTVHHFEDGKRVLADGLASPACPAASKAMSYDDNGYPNIVEDFNRHKTDLDYDAHGHLMRKVEALNTSAERTTTYEWDEAKNRITKVTVANLRQTVLAYGGDGRLASEAVTNLSANGVTGQTRTTTFQYTYHGNGMLKTASLDGPLASDTITRTFSADGNLLTVSNGLGHTTTYSEYDAMGQARKVEGPNGETTRFTFDERGRPKTVVAVVGGIAQPATVYTYDDKGRLSTTQTPDGRVLTREYDAAWRLAREYEPEPGGTWAVKRYAYNNASQVTSAITERTTAVFPPAVPALTLPNVGAEGAYRASWSGVGGADSYLLSESANGGAWTTAYDGAALLKDFTGRPAADYAHAVAACNAAGCSAFSAVATVKVRYKPTAAPEIAFPVYTTNGAFTIKWFAVPRGATYYLEESVNGGAWQLVQNVAAFEKSFSGKPAGTYAYRVSGCNEAGCGPAMSGTVREIDPPTGAPTISAPAVNATGSFTVSWTGVNGALTYRLEENINAAGWYEVQNNASGSRSFTGKNTSVPHYYRVSACNEAGCGSPVALTVQQIIYGAEFVWQGTFGISPPYAYNNVTVQMRNTGNTTWTDADGYRLGSQNPHDNGNWGMNRVGVPGAVPPGGVATFNFTVRSPGSAGLYNFQWRMVRDGYTWFGATSPNVVIEVANAWIQTNPHNCPIYIGEWQCSVNVSWGTTRSDAQVWVTNLDNTGWQLFDGRSNGNANAPWITTSGKRFHVVVAGVSLASWGVAAYQVNEYPPNPDPGGCVPNPPIYTCDPL
ncbi:DUF6531 domain-containing protein [Lysobacter soli]|uniref:DUF6531 domain-containing protein n=1 Tax=Lysobacter soli TaxID=453783 RepID=UPI0036970D0A